jgi:hypothetical protein
MLRLNFKRIRFAFERLEVAQRFPSRLGQR